ncbi:hypothetical protein [Dactylosporangium sp. CA-233914]|uniref:hypothetical protein n=1 Tax=Dactylosporangium sp. CA-233914 TaxID=3239934 RepID=UPI003D9470B5
MIGQPRHRRAGRAHRGLGVEIVLEAADRAGLAALHERCRAAGAVSEELRERPEASPASGWVTRTGTTSGSSTDKKTQPV